MMKVDNSGLNSCCFGELTVRIRYFQPSSVLINLLNFGHTVTGVFIWDILDLVVNSGQLTNPYQIIFIFLFVFVDSLRSCWQLFSLRQAVDRHTPPPCRRSAAKPFCGHKHSDVDRRFQTNVDMIMKMSQMFKAVKLSVDDLPKFFSILLITPFSDS